MLQPQCKLFVEGTEVTPEDHISVKALKETGQLDEELEVKEITCKHKGRTIVLGWRAFTDQVLPL